MSAWLKVNRKRRTRPDSFCSLPFQLNHAGEISCPATKKVSVIIAFIKIILMTYCSPAQHSEPDIMENAPFLAALMINQGEAIMSWNSKTVASSRKPMARILKLVLYQTKLFHHRRKNDESY